MMREGLNDATWVVGLLALRGPHLGGAVVANDVADDYVSADRAATLYGGIRDAAE